jgi:hypothetical protein
MLLKNSRYFEKIKKNSHWVRNRNERQGAKIIAKRSEINSHFGNEKQFPLFDASGQSTIIFFSFFLRKISGFC